MSSDELEGLVPRFSALAKDFNLDVFLLKDEDFLPWCQYNQSERIVEREGYARRVEGEDRLPFFRASRPHADTHGNIHQRFVVESVWGVDGGCDTPHCRVGQSWKRLDLDIRCVIDSIIVVGLV
jgi:hypothetical protein